MEKPRPVWSGLVLCLVFEAVDCAVPEGNGGDFSVRRLHLLHDAQNEIPDRCGVECSDELLIVDAGVLNQLVDHDEVDKAVLMADLYHKPELRNYYCLHECPIGRTLAISDEAPGLERVTVKLLKNLRVEDLEGVKDRLVDIAEDGKITDDEKPALEEILTYLDRLSKTVSELRIIGEKALGNGWRDEC